MANPKFNIPAPAYAKQEDLEAVVTQVNQIITTIAKSVTDLGRHQEVLEHAVLKVAADNEYLSNLLVDEGILTDGDSEEEETATLDTDPADDYEPDSDQIAADLEEQAADDAHAARVAVEEYRAELEGGDRAEEPEDD